MGKGNNIIPNVHCHKDWQNRVKTWFEQPMRKKRRRLNRLKKAEKVAPRPVKLYLRPMVRCQTKRYNTKLRLGKGFSIEELKAAGVSKKQARGVGISVDHRRTNKSLESLQLNVQRLKEYQSRLILFPKKLSQPKSGDSSIEETKLAAQLRGPILAYKKQIVYEKPRAITEDERKYKAFNTLRQAMARKRLKGYREKKQRDAEAAETGGKK